MSFNAVVVIKDVDLGMSRIFGRVLIKDLKEVPTDLLPQYRGEFISNEVDLGSLMCSPEEPLHLIGFVQSDPSKNAEEEITSLGDLYTPFSKTSGGSNSGGQRGSSCTTPTGSPSSSKLISPILPKRRIREGYLRVSDEAKGIRNGKSSPIRPFKMYEFGMNLRGTCSNDQCSSKSKRSKTDTGEVVVTANYGRVLMTKVATRFPCPACAIPTEGIRGSRKRNHAYLPSELDRTITPEGFYLTYGRTLFRLKKKGVEEPVKRIFEENITSMTCKIFRDSSIISNAESEYDLIEIMTVSKNSSPFFCVKCNLRIEEKEVRLACEHALHSKCESGSGRRSGMCPVCDSTLYKSMTELLRSPGLRDVIEDLQTVDIQEKTPYRWLEGMDNMGVVEKWDKEMGNSVKIESDVGEVSREEEKGIEVADDEEMGGEGEEVDEEVAEEEEESDNWFDHPYRKQLLENNN